MAPRPHGDIEPSEGFWVDIGLTGVVIGAVGLGLWVGVAAYVVRHLTGW